MPQNVGMSLWLSTIEVEVQQLTHKNNMIEHVLNQYRNLFKYHTNLLGHIGACGQYIEDFKILY